MGAPTISVVIPTRDRAAQLARTLRPVLADPATTEVVVVDDGSTDDTASRLAELAGADTRIRVIRTEGVGRVRARQLGVEAASGSLVLLLDDDVVAREHLVTGHRDRHRGHDELVVLGYMPTVVPARRRAGQATTRLYAAEYEARAARWRAGDANVLSNLWLGNVSASRDAWLRVQLDDGAFPDVHHEDQDLGLRMRREGLQGVFDPTLRADHEHERTTAQFLGDSYCQGLGRRAVADRHGLATLADEALGSGLAQPWRALLRLTDRESWAAVIRRTLLGVVAVAGRVHAWSVECAASRFLRRMELRRGVRDGARP